MTTIKNDDPFADAADALIDGLESDVASFGEKSGAILDDMEEGLMEAEMELASARPEIEAAAAEANAEIDDAAIELLEGEGME